MITSQETIEILNDLIQINNDRISGYELALTEIKEEDAALKPLIAAFISQSRRMKNELGQEVHAYEGQIDNTPSNRGKIYRAWMELKAVFTGHDAGSVLANCEFGEDAAERAYGQALEKSLPAYLGEIISNQQKSLRSAHDEIKTFRDQFA